MISWSKGGKRNEDTLAAGEKDAISIVQLDEGLDETVTEPGGVFAELLSTIP